MRIPEIPMLVFSPQAKPTFFLKAYEWGATPSFSRCAC